MVSPATVRSNEMSIETGNHSSVTPAAQDTSAANTLVKVRSTSIKFFSEETNSVEDVLIVGKMSVLDCKTYVRELNDKNVFISKENINEEFEVNTVALYALKEA